jgi:mRNA interferase YafQ
VDNKYTVVQMKKYTKNLKKLAKQGKNLELLKKVVDLLANGEQLPATYKDHQLKGQLQEYRECHIKDDWLLVYQIIKNELILVLVGTGTHEEIL